MNNSQAIGELQELYGVVSPNKQIAIDMAIKAINLVDMATNEINNSLKIGLNENESKEEVEVNSHGTNKNIKFNILTEEEMRKIGFSDYNEKNWFLSRYIVNEISFSVTIPKDGSEAWIDVLDEDFGQPYDYQRILDHDPKHDIALFVYDKVEQYMAELKSKGVIEGHEYGDYI